eukprot:GHUV01045729.1.p1 GENE.GHUV01045729.1~~GHUV01045729.1.p1  ORF type:complete len:199 (-),score=26.51 GHUV01045729.1:234-830(-)
MSKLHLSLRYFLPQVTSRCCSWLPYIPASHEQMLQLVAIHTRTQSAPARDRQPGYTLRFQSALQVHIPAFCCIIQPAAGDRECERSALVNEEIVYFIFQLELDAQLQRALNYEAYEAAQQIRVKRETVDMALRDMQERKASSAASSFSSMSEDDETVAMGQAAQASLDLSDSMSEGLRLRSEMQRAVQEERCVRFSPV